MSPLDYITEWGANIDLVQITAGPIGGVLDAIRHALDPWLGAPRRTTKQGRIDLIYRMSSEGEPPIPMRLKVEINTKLRALYQRKKARDLFDLFIASRRAKVSPMRVVECFGRYLEHDGQHVSRAELEMNLREKLSDDTFLSDVALLVAPDIDWNIGDAAEYVRRELLPLLPGEPWRGGG